jgi:hypothetical protein
MKDKVKKILAKLKEVFKRKNKKNNLKLTEKDLEEFNKIKDDIGIGHFYNIKGVNP